MKDASCKALDEFLEKMASFTASINEDIENVRSMTERIVSAIKTRE